MATKETKQTVSHFTDEVENEQVILDENQFERLIKVLNTIDDVRDGIDDLANGKGGQIDMFKLSYELGKAYSALCTAYNMLDDVTDELNPAHAMDNEEDDDE